ncbi:DNA topoisomerase 1 [Caenorhabditis elegans]|uniref:DNA topoisomerase 1 n=1 Tax=Caenorhabditis elegans TaxID=6239 RepID=TOP1_CAEEL|nr:DNA topoisomerase 1 [Caenorhabditis elegans]O17966.1 RecName: Full=DNA topoisomerase 1; AltName: Full=DNA topoisomerase I; Short=topoI [Caenorhabditis elegans]CAB07640.1 DNA topoisomerase 1 [Caenorhabditis elegans]|eukprot:NP_493337.1 DNA topoisomerase 1 [Caenorhabditis elegans]
MSVVSNHHSNGNGNSTVYDTNGNDEIKKEVKDEPMASDSEVPFGELMKRDKKEKKQKKRKAESGSDEDDYKPEKRKSSAKNGKKKDVGSDSEDDYKPEKKKSKKNNKKKAQESSEDDDEESEGDVSEEDVKPQIHSDDELEEEDEAPTTDDEEEQKRKEKERRKKEKREKKERKEKKRLEKENRKIKEEDDEDSDDEDDEKAKKKKRKSKGAEKSKPSTSKKDAGGKKEPPKKKVKKEEDIEDIWEWWKEEKKPAGVKWNSLQHCGPLFAPPYIPLPSHVHFKYGGEKMKLTLETEEIAQFYAGVLDHEYSTKEAFNKNFMKDWRKVMTVEERERIHDLKKCDFRAIDAYQKEQREIRKAMTKEEKLKIKEEKEAEVKIYGIAIIDGHRQKVANFRIEPPGVFRGRGGHPKMGLIKKRIMPEDVIINCGKDTEIPKPPPGHKWKEVRHDNTVTWLCSWTESVLGQNKYIMLNPSSKIKGEKDFEKYETARRLKKKIGGIRERYTDDFKSKEMRVRQRATALYFIDKLALRAGNEKDVDEAADTVGCCSLRVEHIKLFDSAKLNEDDKKEKEFVVEFDFLGKDSIRYFNRVSVEKRVYKNLKIFMEGKAPSDDLFDRLDTATLNDHLRSLMDGLTVKVFRTYNASITLQEQLIKLTNPKDNVAAKILSYNRANRQVAILCNHQRAVSKGFDESMQKLEQKIKDKKKEVKEAEAALKSARGAEKEKAQKKYDRLKEQLKKLKISRTDKDENKQIALGTSKLNYIDPRITVAWCKKFEVPLEKVFTKTHREKFRWAIDMTNSSDEEYVF